MCETCDKLRKFVADPATELVLHHLGRRQRQALNMRIKALPTREIASRMNISHQTAKNHIWKSLEDTGIYSSELTQKFVARIEEILDESI